MQLVNHMFLVRHTRHDVKFRHIVAEMIEDARRIVGKQVRLEIHHNGRIQRIVAYKLNKVFANLGGENLRRFCFSEKF